MSNEGSDKGSRRIVEVLIVDGDKSARESFSKELARDGDFEVCGLAGGGGEADDILKSKDAGAAIVEMSIDGGHGLEYVRRVSVAKPGMKVMVVSACEDLGYVRRAFQAGASGYVSKRGGAVNVVRGIRAVVSGKVHISHDILEKIIEARTS